MTPDFLKQQNIPYPPHLAGWEELEYYRILRFKGAVTGEKLPRPMTHDLMHTILTSFGGKVTQAVITLKDRTYYGALTVAMPNGTKVFDSRSSDAIALAIHFKAPILVGRDLLESAGPLAPESKGLSL